VAEIAAWLAFRIANRSGDPVAIDRRVVDAAALLHDVGKVLPADDPARALGHAAASAEWLTRRGYAELGPAVAAHPVTRLLDPDAADTWLTSATLEERVVAYADKRAGQRLEAMSARFGSWRQRFPGGQGAPADGGWDEDVAAAVRERAARLEAAVCASAEVDPGQVRRLRWTDRAIRAVTATAVPGTDRSHVAAAEGLAGRQRSAGAGLPGRGSGRRFTPMTAGHLGRRP
jgi:HD domain